MLCRFKLPYCHDELGHVLACVAKTGASVVCNGLFLQSHFQSILEDFYSFCAVFPAANCTGSKRNSKTKQSSVPSPKNMLIFLPRELKFLGEHNSSTR
jgi:hypothetical protein